MPGRHATITGKLLGYANSIVQVQYNYQSYISKQEQPFNSLLSRMTCISKPISISNLFQQEPRLIVTSRPVAQFRRYQVLKSVGAKDDFGHFQSSQQ